MVGGNACFTPVEIAFRGASYVLRVDAIVLAVVLLLGLINDESKYRIS